MPMHNISKSTTQTLTRFLKHSKSPSLFRETSSRPNQNILPQVQRERETVSSYIHTYLVGTTGRTNRPCVGRVLLPHCTTEEQLQLWVSKWDTIRHNF